VCKHGFFNHFLFRTLVVLQVYRDFWIAHYRHCRHHLTLNTALSVLHSSDWELHVCSMFSFTTHCMLFRQSWGFLSTGQYTVFAREKPHFFDKNLPSKIGVRLFTEYYVLLTTEPTMSVLYVVKLPVETASVWDCYLASFLHTRECANVLPMYRHILITWV
jgi:hypothetical protein